MCSNYRTDSPKTCSSILSSFSCKLRFLLSLLHVLIVYVKLIGNKIGNKRGKWKGKKEDDDDNEEEEQKQEREREQEQQIDIVLFHYVKKKKTQQHEQSKKKHKKGDDLHAAPTPFSVPFGYWRMITCSQFPWSCSHTRNPHTCDPFCVGLFGFLMLKMRVASPQRDSRQWAVPLEYSIPLCRCF